MADGEDLNLLIDCTDESAHPQAVPPRTAGRPYIGVAFECCGVYARIYRAPDETEYTGRCPNCLRTLRVRVGPDGVQTRIFRAS